MGSQSLDLLARGKCSTRRKALTPYTDSISKKHLDQPSAQKKGLRPQESSEPRPPQGLEGTPDGVAREEGGGHKQVLDSRELKKSLSLVI